MKKIKKLMKKYERYIIAYAVILFIILLMIFLFTDAIVKFTIIMVFIFLNIIVRFYKNIFPGLPIEIETVIFGGLITTITCGFWAGIIVVLFGSILGEFFNRQISPWSLVNILMYILVPIVGFFLSAGSLVIAGLVLMIIINIIVFIVDLILGYDIFKNSAFALTNILWNWFLFSYLALPVLSLIV